MASQETGARRAGRGPFGARPEDHYLKRELYQLVRDDPAIFDFLQAGSLDGLWYWDLERPEEEWLSPRFKEVLGYADHEVPNSSRWWQENIFPEDLEVALANFDRHCADPSHPYDQVVRYRHRNGSTVWVRCRGIVIRDADGRPVRMLGAHTDVTGLKVAEEELARARDELERRVVRRTEELRRANAELERSNAELEQYATLASHDLQAPLRAIVSFLRLLEQEAGGVLGARGREYLETAVEGAGRMQALIQALLEYSRVGHGELRSESIEVAALLRDVVAGESTAIEETGARVTWDELPRVEWVREWLRVVFQNLIENALRFRSDAPPRIHVSARREPGAWRFSVADNGIGIDPAHHQQIFEVFRRLHPRDRYPGTGIGLALVKKLVESHGGRVEVDSAPGHGSVFSFSVRIA